MNIRKFVFKIMNICMVFCYGPDILAMRRVSHLPIQLPNKRPVIKTSGLEGEGEKIIVPLNSAQKSKAIASMINDLRDAHLIIKDKTIPLDAPVQVIKDSFDMLQFPDS